MMSKKTYHIVDPETGKFVQEVDAGGLDNFIYQMTATGWSKRLRWAFRIALFLCVVLTIAESVLRERFPVLYDGTGDIILAGDIVALIRATLAVRRFLRGKFRRGQEIEKKEEEKIYHIVDPETGKVVGTQRPEEKEKQVDTTSRGYRFSRAMYYFTESCFLLTLLAFVAVLFIPKDWHPIFGIAGVIFMILWGFGKIIWRYKLYEIENEEVDKFELTMARLTLICAFLAVPFGIAALVLPGEWARYAAGLFALSFILALIGNSVWRSEQWDRKYGGRRK